MSPGTISAVAGGISICVVPVVLLLLKDRNALNLKKLDNRVVSESLFRDELAKRDKDIEDLRTKFEDLIKTSEAQRRTDLIEVESWKGKYEEQVEVNAKLSIELEKLKTTVNKVL